MDEDLRTLYCGNLSSRCNETLLYELFLQGGPLEKVYIPKDRDGSQKTFGFITYKHSISVPYAINLFEGTSLYNRTLTLKTRQAPELPSLLQQHSPIPINYSNINQIHQMANPMFINQTMPNISLNMVPMFLPPGVTTYPSQIYSSSLEKQNRYSARNHPYHRDRERDSDRTRNYRERERDRERHSNHDHEYRSQNHRREHRSQHRSQHRGSNDYPRNSNHYR